MLSVSRLEGELSRDFASLARAAAAEGVGGLQKISADWQAGARWRNPGAALFVAAYDERLVGIGGVTPCPDLAGAERMRRFYVLPTARRARVGRALALAAIEEGLRWSSILTCNAQASAAAPAFWESLGFKPSTHPGLTHVLEG